MFATGETVGLAEWIIDDTCLVYYNYENFEIKISHMSIQKLMWIVGRY